jgi:hypothetical protein
MTHTTQTTKRVKEVNSKIEAARYIARFYTFQNLETLAAGEHITRDAYNHQPTAQAVRACVLKLDQLVDASEREELAQKSDYELEIWFDPFKNLQAIAAYIIEKYRHEFIFKLI